MKQILPPKQATPHNNDFSNPGDEYRIKFLYRCQLKSLELPKIIELLGKLYLLNYNVPFVLTWFKGTWSPERFDCALMNWTFFFHHPYGYVWGGFIDCHDDSFTSCILMF